MARKEIGAVFLREYDGWWYFKYRGKAVKLVKHPATRDEAEVAKAAKIREFMFAPNVNNKTLDEEKVKTLVEKYIEQGMTSLAPHSQRCRKIELRRFTEKFGELTYNELTSSAIKEWLFTVPSWNAGGRRHACQSVKACFRYWLDADKLTINRVRSLKIEESNARNEKFAISKTNHQLILQAAPEWMKDIITALWYSGARPDEVLGLTADEYEPMFTTWEKKKHKTSYKGKQRTIKLCGPLIGLTERLIARHQTGRLFRGPKGGTVTVSYFGQRLKEVATKAGIPEAEVRYIIPYSYRHRYAVDLLLAGVSDTDVAALLGHGKGTTTLYRHYAHTLAEVKNKGRQMDQLLTYREGQE